MNIRFIKSVVLSVEDNDGNTNDVIFYCGKIYSTLKLETNKDRSIVDIFLKNGFIIRGVPSTDFENNNTKIEIKKEKKIASAYYLKEQQSENTGRIPFIGDMVDKNDE